MASRDEQIRAAKDAVVEAAMDEWRFIEDNGWPGIRTDDTMRKWRAACKHLDALTRPLTAQEAIDEVRTLLERVAQQREPLCDRHNSDICDCLGDDIRRALRKEREEE